MAVVLGIIVVVIGLSIFSGGEDPAEEESAPTTSTSTPTTATRPSNTTRPSDPQAERRPILDGPRPHADLGVALVVVSNSGEVVTIDLDTGTEYVTNHAPIEGTNGAMWFENTLAVVGRDPSTVFRLASDGSGEWSSLQVPGYRIEPAWGANDLMWAWSASGGGSHSGLVVASPAGEVSFVELPEDFTDMQGVGAIQGWAVVTGYDGIFAIHPSGERHRLGYGRVLGIDGNYLVHTDCDAQARCRLVKEAVVEGRFDPDTRIDLGDVGASWAKPSPDGRSVALIGFGLRGSWLRVVSTDQEDLYHEQLLIESPAAIQWTANSEGLVWVNSGGRILNLMWTRGERAVGETISWNLRLSSRHLSGLLVPLADVPPALMPASDG